MDVIVDIINNLSEANVPMAVLALATGVVVFVFFFALIVPSSRKPAKRPLIGRKNYTLTIQQRLDKEQMDITAAEYIKRSLTYGIPVAIGLALIVGSVSLIALGIAAGFLTTWTKLEQERDRKQVKFNKQLASACDTIRTAYGVNPSLKKALEAVAEYGEPPVKDDFQEILLAASQERFIEGLEAVAERRKSIVFDTVVTSLIRASEASGEVNEMLLRLADSTRQNVAAYEEALTSQLNARSSVQWGTYGPWAIFCIFRIMTTLMSAGVAGAMFAPMTSYFSTIPGNLVALAAAFVSIFIYRYCNQVAQRGLVVRRVSVSVPVVPSGQKPLGSAQGPVVLSGQTRPVSAN